MMSSAEPPIMKSFYIIPRIPGRFVGIWPQEKRPWFKNLMSAFGLIVVLIGACGETLYGILNLDNLVSALEAFCPGTTKAVCVLKLSIFVIYHRQWFEFVKRLRKMLCANQDDKAQQILIDVSTTANRFTLLLFTSGFTTGTCFVVLPLIMGIYRWSQDQPIQIQLPFNIILPEFATEHHWFPLTYMVLTASSYWTGFIFSFVDGFFVCSCLYISGIFRVVKHDIRSAFADLDGVDYCTPSMNAGIRVKLGYIIERHNAIFDLCSELSRQSSVIVLMHFISAAFVLCSTILDIMLNTSSLSGLTYICYIAAALTQLFLYCYGGNHVSDSSLDVAATVYDIEWYKCDARTRKMILMILRRSQRAKTIAVPFFTPSLPAFSSILSTTGSYITLLKTFL
ncbi:GH10871 [Drosophila grimshawi]|uniref:Odorant receptor n=1 Tax=Drosophila grimshawi TaxID=7222 RepID=B4JAI0_DROGR|nr:GH10871 [Drosophila grimshawi]